MIWILLGAMAVAAFLAVGRIVIRTDPRRLLRAASFASSAAWAVGLALTLSGKPVFGLTLLGLGAMGLGLAALPKASGGRGPSEGHRRGPSSGRGPDVEGDAHRRQGRGGGMSGPGVMTEQEAYQVLGLEPGASAEQIVRAHRTLMKKLHPDHGGTTALAARVNAARDLLMRPSHR
ncbi:J domain-containing protein [Methylopila turkensis]|uniref:J domain-containing protein n=1 Tax=Methylopila turkensis TaxID=1437816 RepID=A0A9W6N7Q8_9HYPH|nr:hypothetical protein GCM10008174_25290 [Methylopila turkensis]